MTARYQELLTADAREVLLCFELVLKGCSNVIGDAATGGLCTVAPIPADGLRCDYNRHSCGLINAQPEIDYVAEDVSHFFASRLSASSDLPQALQTAWEPNLHPCLKKVSALGQDLDVEDGFTRPDVLEVEFAEMGGAVYYSDGTFMDLEQCPEFNVEKPIDKRNRARTGLFFRRLKFQYPHLKGSTVKLWRGFVREDFELADMEEIWRGQVDNLVTDEGRAKITCSDWLSSLELAIPPATDATITADLSTEAASIPVLGIDQFTDPASISGLVVVRSLSVWTGRYEYMTVTGLDASDGVLGALEVTRGTHGSQKEPHAKDQPIEEVYTTITPDGLSGTTLPDIILDVLDRATIAATDYDATQLAGIVKWTGSWLFKRTIPEEGKRAEELTIRAMLFELLGDIFIGNLMISSDLKLQAMVSAPAEPGEETQSISDADIKAGTLAANLNEGSRLTAVVIHYGKVQGEDKFRRRVIALNGETTVEGYYEGRKTKVIKTPWLSVGQRTLAQQSAVLRNGLFAHAAERVAWESELRDAAIAMGVLSRITSFQIQDGNGAPRTHAGRVVGKEWDGVAAFKHVSQSTGYDPDKRWAFIQENGLTDYDSSSEAQRDAGAFLGEIFDGATLAGDPFDRADESPLSSPWRRLSFAGDEFDLVDEQITTQDIVFATGPNFHAELTGVTPWTASGYGWVQARVAWSGNPLKCGSIGVGGNYKSSSASVHVVLSPSGALEVVTGLGGGRISHGGAGVPALSEGRFYTIRLETAEQLFKVFIDGELAARITPTAFWWPYAGGSRRPSLLVENATDNTLGWWRIDDLEAGEPLLQGVRVGSSFDPGYCII